MCPLERNSITSRNGLIIPFLCQFLTSLKRVTFLCMQVVEDGYEFFAYKQLVTVFSAPNYCGEFDNAGAFISVDDTLLCSFRILKPAEKKPRSKSMMNLFGSSTSS